MAREMTLKRLTPEETAVFEWQYGYCGSFKKALWTAICKADDDNLALIGMGFPVEVEGYRLYKEHRGWWESVQEKARKLAIWKGGK